jgi:guanylate kinase
MSKKIILVGPSASGKSLLRKRFEDRGFVSDVSYTSREPREGEVDGVHYHFLSKLVFAHKINSGFFYEYVEYNGNYYGTGLYEWNNADLFIMETDGIKHIKPEDRKSCFVIYLNPSESVRINRMRQERNWGLKQITERILTDNLKFNNFTDYDILITNPDF